MPLRVKKVIKTSTKGPDGQQVLTEHTKLVIPWQSPILDQFPFTLCGGTRCVEGRRGCECLQEPVDGEQPAWQNPCVGSSGDSGDSGVKQESVVRERMDVTVTEERGVEMTAAAAAAGGEENV